MRLSAYLGLSLLLLALAGCGGSNASTSSETTPPDTTNPPGDGDDNGDGDSGGDGDGGDDDGGNDNGGGDTGTPPPDCAFTDPVAPVVSETLGNTNDPDMYSLAHYSERTDLNTDLTGTWVMVHRQTQRYQTSQERNTTATWQKSVFIIRNNGGTLEAANCFGGGFTALTIENNQLTLPVFAANSSAPSFALVSGSQSSLTGINLTGSANTTYSDQFTGAIKVSDSVTALGQSSVTVDGNSDYNADIVCVTQKRELTMEQVCTEAAQPSELTLTLLSATDNDRHRLLYRADGLYTLDSQLAAIAQLSAPATNTINADAASIAVNLSLDNAVTLPGATSSSGSLIFTATLPGAVPAP